MDAEPENRAHPLHVHERRYVIAPPDMGGQVMRTVEATVLDGNGMPRTVEHHQIFQAGCGHYVGFAEASELVGVCAVCQATLCHRCGQVRCHMCLQLLCPEHAFTFLSAIYCRGCRRWAFGKAAGTWVFSTSATALRVGVQIAQFIMNCIGRIIVALCSCIARLLEKG